MRIAFVSEKYPTRNQPGGETFVQQFVWAMARLGHECMVIHPTSVLGRRAGPLPDRLATEAVEGGQAVTIHRPRFLSCSSKNLGWTHTGRWTQWGMDRAVLRALRSLPAKPDLVYGHFLYHAGHAAVAAGRRLGIPAVVGVGEGVFWTVDPFGFARARRDFRSAAGFLAVATHIRDGLIADIGVPRDKIVVEPNGVDLSRFRPGDRAQARSRLGLPADAFLIAFVGTFDDLKGGAELVAAVEGLGGVSLFMIGPGEKTFHSKHLLHQGRVPHAEVPLWLNAADLFVLPTREEGSCNAAIEAIACGLPLVTSNGHYMDDIADDEISIRVDPRDVAAIRAAILALKSDPERRRRMSEACLRKAPRFDINERVKRISAWMEGLLANCPSGSPAGGPGPARGSKMKEHCGY